MRITLTPVGLFSIFLMGSVAALLGIIIDYPVCSNDVVILNLIMVIGILIILNIINWGYYLIKSFNGR